MQRRWPAASRGGARGRSDLRFVYDDHLSLEKKAEAVATRVYGAARVAFEPKARRRLDQIEAAGYGHLPICMAKTQSPFLPEASQRGAPRGHTVTVREVRLAAGRRVRRARHRRDHDDAGTAEGPRRAPHRRRRRRPRGRPQLTTTFSPDPGSFTFTPDLFRCEAEPSRTGRKSWGGRGQARPSATIGAPSSRRAITTLSRSSRGATRMTPGTRPTST